MYSFLRNDSNISNNTNLLKYSTVLKDYTRMAGYLLEWLDTSIPSTGCSMLQNDPTLLYMYTFMLNRSTMLNESTVRVLKD